MIRETSELYECKGCGGCVASEQLSCPYCGKSEGETVERSTFGDETKEVTKSWYRRVEILPERVQG